MQQATERFWRRRLAGARGADPSGRFHAAGPARGGPRGRLHALGPGPHRPARRLRARAADHRQHPGPGGVAAAAPALHRPAHGGLRRHGLGPAGRAAGCAHHAGPVHQHAAGDRDPPPGRRGSGTGCARSRPTTWRCASTSTRPCRTSSAGPAAPARRCSTASSCSRTTRSTAPCATGTTARCASRVRPTPASPTSRWTSWSTLEEDGLEIEYMFLRASFDTAAVLRLRGHMEWLLEQLIEDAGRPLGLLGLATPAERQRLAARNALDPADTGELPVHRLIERQAAARPEAMALRFDDAGLTFGELDARSSSLAACLRRHGVGPETLVGVAMRRRPDLLVSFLAVLKAGGAYVPIDRDYPAERIAYMIRDAGLKIVLTDAATRGRLPLPDGVVALEVDRLDLRAEPAVLPPVPLHPEQPRLPDLHLGLDRQAQSRGREPRCPGHALPCDRRPVRDERPGPRAGLHVVLLRRCPRALAHRTGAWRQRRRARRRPLGAGGDPGGAAPARRHRRRLPARLPAAAGPARGGGRKGAAGAGLLLRRRRRAAGRVRARAAGPAAGSDRQRLRPHRDRGDADDLAGRAGRMLRGRLCADRRPGRQPQHLGARCRPQPAAARHRRRAPSGRPGRGARLSRPSRPHRRALHPRPVQRGWRPALPHGRPRAPATGRPLRLSGPSRPSGEDPRLPH